jgi:Ca2+-transporting ATPase
VVEAVAIGAALVVDALIGFVTELRAERSMDALRQLDRSTTRVRRDGETCTVGSDELVPGDVVELAAGDVVPADARVVRAAELEVDESALTGESVPVAKDVDPVAEVPLAERTSAVHKGTAVSRGSGVVVVVGTGMDTEIGHISALVEEAEAEVTPLERRLDQLGTRLLWLTLAMAAIVAASGLLAGRDPRTIIETAVILGVAAVPEGLPIVASLALARGVRRMARRQALVKRLSAVETLGSAGVIMTDKTGTLTEGRMRLEVVELPDDRRCELGAEDVEPLCRRAVELAALCTDADADEDTGDPTELGLLRALDRIGTDAGELEARHHRVDVRPFERDSKMMATFHDEDDGVLVAVKGAPGAVLEAATHVRTTGDEGAQPLTEDDRDAWLRRNRQLAAEGLRVLAVAEARRDEPDPDGPYHDLVLVGLLGLLDPPREAAVDAVAECRRAGIRVIMLTGDQPATAAAIATQVGVADDDPRVVAGAEVDDPDEAPVDEQQDLLGVDVFARVSPEDKLDLVTLHQDHGAIVAMTGDGVNDAPALEKADIGIAMGERGTEVAQDAADIVLLDDAFDTIVEAVRYGRTVFDNIRKFIVFLLSGNLAEILAVTAATVAGLPLPLLPLQILYINFVADIFPALALGMTPASRDVMAHPPRDPDEPILTRRLWGEVSAWGALITVTVLGGLLVALWQLGVPEDEVAGITFLTFGFARVWHTLNMRRPGGGILRNEVTTNPWTWVAVGIGVTLMLAATYVGPLASLLEVAAPTAAHWAVILAGSLTPLVVGQIGRTLQRGA